MSGADRPIICARPCTISTSMASAAMAPNTLSATASGLMACCTWPRMTSERLTLKVGALTLRCVACCSCRCRSAASVARCRCSSGIPAVPRASRNPIHA